MALGIGGPGTFDERGLLGLAFHPDYAQNGRLHTYTSEPVAGPADFTVPAQLPFDHQSVVTEWQVPVPADPAAVVDPASARELLRIDEPQFNHDAGALAFGPDARAASSCTCWARALRRSMPSPRNSNPPERTRRRV